MKSTKITQFGKITLDTGAMDSPQNTIQMNSSVICIVIVMTYVNQIGFILMQIMSGKTPKKEL